MKTLFISLKSILAVYAFIIMFYASNFSLGTTESWESSIRNNLWGFFFGRLLFTVIAGCIFLPISLLLNRMFRKSISYKWKHVLLEFIVIVITASLLVSKTIFWDY